MRWLWNRKAKSEADHEREIAALEVDSHQVISDAKDLTRELRALMRAQTALAGGDRRNRTIGHRPERRGI